MGSRRPGLALRPGRSVGRSFGPPRWRHRHCGAAGSHAGGPRPGEDAAQPGKQRHVLFELLVRTVNIMKYPPSWW